MELKAPIHIDHVAIVDKPASGIGFKVTKSADGSYRFESFVPFEKSEDADGGCSIAGIAYPAGTAKDLQGDFARPPAVAAMKASHDAGGRRLNLQHKTDLPKDIAEVTKSQILPSGSWHLTTRIHDPKLADAVRKGLYTGYSIAGTAKGVPDDDRDEGAPMTKQEEAELAEIEQLTAMAKQLIEVLKDVDGDTDRDKLKAAQQDRARKYGIPVISSSHLTPPAGYPTDPEQYGDPVGYLYPVHDPAHARNAAARFAQKSNEYPPEARAKVDARIKAAEKKHGVAAVSKSLEEWLESAERFIESGGVEKLQKAVADDAFVGTMRQHLDNASNQLQAQRLPLVKQALNSASIALEEWAKFQNAQQEGKFDPTE